MSIFLCVAFYFLTLDLKMQTIHKAIAQKEDPFNNPDMKVH